jgi:hypothetical protein
VILLGQRQILIVQLSCFSAQNQLYVFFSTVIPRYVIILKKQLSSLELRFIPLKTTIQPAMYFSNVRQNENGRKVLYFFLRTRYFIKIFRNIVT